jgi:prefoldin beta subunit
MELKDNNIQKMHLLEQNLQNLLMQKQAFQLELSETQSALKEMEKSNDDVFKIIGQLMIKTDKEKMKKELIHKEKMLDIRLKTFEKQENSFSEQLEKLRSQILK